MENKRTARLTRAALLLGIMLVIQSLRLMIPVPPLFSTFVIGSLVNSCLILAVHAAGLVPALLIGVLAPSVAYLQGLLPLPVLVIPVAAANAIYLFVYSRASLPAVVAIPLAAGCKMALLWLSIAWLADWLTIPNQLAAGLTFIMSWPQMVTGMAGGWIALVLYRRIRPLL